MCCIRMPIESSTLNKQIREVFGLLKNEEKQSARSSHLVVHEVMKSSFGAVQHHTM